MTNNHEPRTATPQALNMSASFPIAQVSPVIRIRVVIREPNVTFALNKFDFVIPGAKEYRAI